MTSSTHPPALSLFGHPYSVLAPVTGGKRQLSAEGRRPGTALVWRLDRGAHDHDTPVVRDRPGGLPLVVILPRFGGPASHPGLGGVVDSVRPCAVLPYHPDPDPDDLCAVLRRPPEDLAVEITDYVAWRGLRLDRETVHLVRRIVGLSSDLRSISALSRSLYMSRRALGRRFVARGLPVPSHWLHFARLLRVAIRLQNSDDSVLSVGYELGYPDAFSLSNQMVRLTGYRPSEARAFLGWEWLLEAWLRKEADQGSLAPDLSQDLHTETTSPGDAGSAPILGRVAEARPSALRPQGDPERAAG
ncbi:MAG: helix-turn-helix transcriptional regulator [Deltaproteobacteria bacterium]|nr:helix-turn-helix transcriptional regulator [Deltaproteobacteria bacterium]